MFRYLFLVAISAAVVSSLQAGDQSEEPYFLRLVAALRRPSGYSAAMALQANAAYASGISVNPAGNDVSRHTSQFSQLRSSASNLQAFSQSGAWFSDTSITSTIGVPGVGTIPLAYKRTDTIESSTELGLDNSIRSNEFFWGLSRSHTDYVATGVQMRFLTADVRYEEISPITGAPTRILANVNWGFDLTLGTRLQLTDSIALGAVGSFGWLSVTSEVSNLVPLPNPVPPPPTIPPGTLLATVVDRPQTGIVRVGVAMTPSEKIGIYLDGEYFEMRSDLEGSIGIGRGILGMEYKHCAHRSFFLGGSIDDAAEFTFSVGSLANLTTNLQLSWSYQHNAYPEVEKEFGTFEQVSLSAALWF